MNTFSSYLKKKFGEPVYKVSIDAGFKCPNKPRCNFCNLDSYVPESANKFKSMEEQLHDGIEFYKKHRKAKKFLAYFQANTNSNAEIEVLESLYKRAMEYSDKIVGLSISTRPDCVNTEFAELIKRIGEKKLTFVELGLQSIFNDDLLWLNRQHTFEQFLDAHKILSQHGTSLIIHLMFGLPNDTEDKMIKTAETLSELGVFGVKIHHLHVVKHTKLEKMYYNNEFTPVTLEKYIQLITTFIKHLDPKITIHRLIADTPDELLIAPRWTLGKQEIISKIRTNLHC